MRRRWLVPGLVALVCFGPLALAIALRYGPLDAGWLPTLPGSRELISPPLATPPGWLAPAAEIGAGARYRWFLVYARMAACDQACERDLERLRQVQTALGRDAERVQRVFLHGGEPGSVAADLGLVLRRFDDPPGDAIARALAAQELGSGRVYIGDPQGSLVASYPRDVAQKELLRDLERLLTVGATN